MFQFGTNSGLPSFQGDNPRKNGVTFNIINVNILFSLIWLLSSVSLVGFGLLHCKHYTPKTKLKCDNFSCVFTPRESNTAVDNTPIAFKRKDFEDAYVIRLREEVNMLDEDVNTKRKVGKPYGTTVEVKFLVEEDTVESSKSRKKDKRRKVVSVSGDDMGKGVAEKMQAEIIGYFRNQGVKRLNISYGSSYTTSIGLISITIGLLSSCLSLYFGQWKEPTLGKKNM